MNQIKNHLSIFKAIGLENLNSIELLKRHDTKYIFHRDKLPSVFKYLNQYYNILEIDGKRIFKYENMYYDTDDYFFYHQHHNQRINRYKVRLRRYIDSDKCYLELKFKNNKGKTIKNRLLLKDKNFNSELSEESKIFAGNYILDNDEIILDKIRPKLLVDFYRITLAGQSIKERITFDINLTYTDRYSNTFKLNNLIIAELKQENFSMNSPFIKCFRELRFSPMQFSKYCMGIALTEKNVKSNRFKKKLLTLQKVC
ncbi:MAG: polyphosphate polymerase domain-containing protein [Spirochaetes bacterium]|nr:polyphosphate polymerase domain-containing protein [Spirochaetota bacterium]